MSKRFFILVPPSESKASGGWSMSRAGDFDDALRAQRDEVLTALCDVVRSSSRSEVERVLGARGVLLNRTIDAMTLLCEGRAPLLPSWRRYTGVVWSHLDPGSLTSAQRRRLLIPSGLYGLTGAEDPVGEYRLKMNVSVASLGNVSAFWRPVITSLVATRVRSSTVVNLLPKEHAAAIDFESLQRVSSVVHVEFVGADGSRAVGHGGKSVKGMVARALLEGGVEVLYSFRWKGWRAHQVEGLVRIVAPPVG